MAEGGQLTEDLSRTVIDGSDVYFDFYCYLCHEEDRHVEAFGYCRDCSDYLCEDCYKSHCRPKPMRHHVLLDRQHMPKDLNSSHNGVPLDRCTDTCIKHPDKVIEYYCHSHDTLGCSACAFVDHRNCENVDHIPDVADRIDQSEEFKDMQDKLRYLERKACQVLQDSQDNISVSNKYSNDAVTAVQSYIQEVISTLDKLKIDLNAESEKLQFENEKRLKTASTNSNAMLLEIRGTLQGLSTLKMNRQYCNLFVAVKKAQKALPTVSRDLDITEHDSIVAEFKFEPSLQFWNVLHQQRAIGQIAVSHHTFDDSSNGSNRADCVTVPDPGHETGNIPKRPTFPKRRENAPDPPGVISPSTKQNIKRAEEHFPNTSTDPKLRHRSKSKPFGGSSPFTDASPKQAGEKSTKPATAKKPSGDSSHSSKDGCTGNKNTPVHDEHNNVTARHVTDINVKTKNDEENCWISGLAVLPGDKLIAVEHKNESVKVIDTLQQKLIYELKLQSAPWDATYVDNDKVAVTTMNRTIQYLNVSMDGTVSISRSINVIGCCHGIAFARERLWVSYKYPKKVEMLTLDGEVQVCISTDVAGHQIFSDLLYIAISPNTEEIYVSDKHAIIRLSSTGNVLSVNKGKWSYNPTGIYAAADGAVYVCDYGGGIHTLTAQCKKKMSLLSRNQISGHPQGLSYNEATKQLFVGMLVGNIIKVFQLT